MNLKKVRDSRVDPEVLKKAIEAAASKDEVPFKTSRGDYKIVVTHDEPKPTYHLFSPEGVKCPGTSFMDPDKFEEAVTEYLYYDA